ncbi:tyrosine-type recombinase/integrase [Oxalobacter paraformigenes]|uniref:Tyr recombinase domain-containing protein n=2 Tax=Oxalobacter paraformigenes TaxID=556268 RepID=C3X337_9BURK|nr:site-specific integrase [Oxalobacter paraformigenes]EEO27623.2 hypothetical protein OFAG_00776 [Oxalobacter paraformigenes]
MASITKRGDSWFVQIRRKGHKSISRSFKKKTQAQIWARNIESEIDARKYEDTRTLSDYKFAELIDRYNNEIGSIKPFGRNKVDVISRLRKMLGHVYMDELTESQIMDFVKIRMGNGAGGVTISIDLSYMSSIFRAAKQLWKIPVSIDVLLSVRANLKYMGIKTRSKERERRPTVEELNLLDQYFRSRPFMKTPMADIIQFAIISAMRDSEITRITWSDLNIHDKTIIIRDRKHPKEKDGNDQEVPLLGKAFDIVMRQPRTSERIFSHQPHTISTLFTRACKFLQIDDLRFHDLRHEGISRLFEQGYTIEQVMLVSGHRDPKQLFRYVQLKAKDLHR